MPEAAADWVESAALEKKSGSATAVRLREASDVSTFLPMNSAVYVEPANSVSPTPIESPPVPSSKEDAHRRRHIARETSHRDVGQHSIAHREDGDVARQFDGHGALCTRVGGGHFVAADAPGRGADEHRVAVTAKLVLDAYSVVPLAIRRTELSSKDGLIEWKLDVAPSVNETVAVVVGDACPPVGLVTEKAKNRIDGRSVLVIRVLRAISRVPVPPAQPPDTSPASSPVGVL
eukprot:1391966-Rhodomonas_salina.2